MENLPVCFLGSIKRRGYQHRLSAEVGFRTSTLWSRAKVRGNIARGNKLRLIKNIFCNAPVGLQRTEQLGSEGDRVQVIRSNVAAEKSECAPPGQSSSNLSLPISERETGHVAPVDHCWGKVCYRCNKPQPCVVTLLLLKQAVGFLEYVASLAVKFPASTCNIKWARKITFHSWRGDDLNHVWRPEGGAILTLSPGLDPGLQRLGEVTSHPCQQPQQKNDGNYHRRGSEVSPWKGSECFSHSSGVIAFPFHVSCTKTIFRGKCHMQWNLPYSNLWGTTGETCMKEGGLAVNVELSSNSALTWRSLALLPAVAEAVPLIPGNATPQMIKMLAWARPSS